MNINKDMKKLKSILLKIAFIFGVLTVGQGIVYGQSSIQDSCTGIHYTDNQDKRCQECLINKLKKDSLIENALMQIKTLEAVNLKNDSIARANEEMLSGVKKTLSRTELKLKISKRLTAFGVPLAITTGFLIGIVITK